MSENTRLNFADFELVMELDLPRLPQCDSFTGIVPQISLTGLQSMKSTPSTEDDESSLDDQDRSNVSRYTTSRDTCAVDRVRRRGDILAGEDSRPGVTYRVVPDSQKSRCIPEEDGIETDVLFPNDREILKARRARSCDAVMHATRTHKPTDRRYVSAKSAVEFRGRSKFSEMSVRVHTSNNGVSRNCRSTSSQETARCLSEKAPYLSNRVSHKRSAVQPMLTENPGRRRQPVVAFNSADIGGDGNASWALTKAEPEEPETRDIKCETWWSESQNFHGNRCEEHSTKKSDYRCGGDHVYQKARYNDYEDPDLILPYIENNKLDFAISEAEEPAKCFCLKMFCKVVLYILYKSSRRGKKNKL